MKKVIAIQTVYTHWSKYSGYHGFIPYLSDEISVTHVRVPFGTKRYFNLPLVRVLIKRMVERSGMYFYSPNDLAVEVGLFIRSLFSRVSVIHFLDGEHGYAYCASLINQISPWLRKRARIISSFHLPPFRLEEVIRHTDHFKLLDRIILVGSNQYDFFRKHVSEDLITLIPHGVDADFFSPPLNGRPSDREKFFCLSVGHHLRDYSLLLEVAEMLKDLPHIQFRIISSSDKLQNVKLENVLIETGISDKDLLEAYRQADLLTMPLVNITANNVILEAMACGLPILTTDVGAIRDYVNGDYGVLVPSGKPEKFAEVLVALAEKPEFCRKMGQKARRIVEEKYDWRNLAPLYEKLYNGDNV